MRVSVDIQAYYLAGKFVTSDSDAAPQFPAVYIANRYQT